MADPKKTVVEKAPGLLRRAFSQPVARRQAEQSAGDIARRFLSAGKTIRNPKLVEAVKSESRIAGETYRKAVSDANAAKKVRMDDHYAVIRTNKAAAEYNRLNDEIAVLQGKIGESDIAFKESLAKFDEQFARDNPRFRPNRPTKTQRDTLAERERVVKEYEAERAGAVKRSEDLQKQRLAQQAEYNNGKIGIPSDEEATAHSMALNSALATEERANFERAMALKTYLDSKKSLDSAVVRIPHENIASGSIVPDVKLVSYPTRFLTVGTVSDTEFGQMATGVGPAVSNLARAFGRGASALTGISVKPGSTVDKVFDAVTSRYTFGGAAGLYGASWLYGSMKNWVSGDSVEDRENTNVIVRDNQSEFGRMKSAVYAAKLDGINDIGTFDRAMESYSRNFGPDSRKSFVDSGSVSPEEFDSLAKQASDVLVSSPAAGAYIDRRIGELWKRSGPSAFRDMYSDVSSNPKNADYVRGFAGRHLPGSATNDIERVLFTNYLNGGQDGR